MKNIIPWIVALNLIVWGCDDGKIEEPSGGEETPAGETAGETPAGETPAGETPGETPAGETPAGETPAGETPAGETPAGEMGGDTPLTQCSDGEDNDGDGAIDLEDAGCADATDDDESDDPLPTTCYERDLINLNSALMNSDYVDYDLSAFGESLTQGSCGGNAGPELTFVYDVTSPLTRLSFDTAFPETVNPVVLYVRDSCEGTAEMTGEDFACNRGSSEVPGTSVDLLDVEPGRYYVFVDTSSAMIGPGPFRLRVTTEGAPQCRDEMDNDGDGLVDLADPGCAQPDDLDETDPDPLPACGDGIDNDGDLLIDYPEDPECSAAGGTREARLCQNDYDEIIEVTGEGGSFLLPFDEMNTTGFTDGCRASSGPEMVMLLTLTEPSNVEVNFEDPTASFSAYIRSSCDDVTSQISCNETLSRPLRALNLEPGEYFLFLDSHTADMAVAPSDFPLVDISITSLVTECNDGIDNDGDNLIDLDDVGCARGSDQSEADPALVPACSDGQDNDGDELVDYPADEGCEAAGSRYESPGCLNIEASAVIGMEGGIVSINTEGLIDNYDPRCNSTTDAAGEQMVELHLDQPAQVNLTLSNPSFDAVLYVRSDCETEEPNGYCNDSDPEALSFLRLERGRYFIFVDGYSTGSGTAELNVEVTPLPQQACEDEEDNDMDGFIDTADPGCSSFFDNDETDEATTPECADGVDNDADELIDFPNDPGCFAQGSATESPVCNVPTPFNAIGQSGGSVTFTPIDGGNFFGSSCGQGEGLEQVIELTLDELSDVEISVTTGADFTTAADAIISLYTACNNEIPELGCLSASAARLPLTEAGTYYLVVERGTGVELPNEDWQISVDVTSRIGECNDEVDNDADDLIDLNDPGCTQPFDLSEEDPAEVPQCFDGLDNDGDSLIDYPQDLDCIAAGDNVEQRRCDNLDAVEVNMQGGSYLFDPSLLEDTTNPSCSSSTGAEAVFAITIEELSSITLNVTEIDGTRASVYTSLRRRCDQENSEISCNGTGELTPTFENINPGVYFLFVERSSFADPLPFNVEIQVEVYAPPACLDGVDNDDDGLIDLNDPGCESPSDETETAPGVETPLCSDGLDNDGDGLTDYPADDFCFSAGASSEGAVCDAFEGDLRVVTGSTMFEFDTTMGASQAYANGTSATSPEIPFALVITEPSAVSVEIANPSDGYDAYLHIRAADCDEGETIAFDDDSGDEGTDGVSNSPFISIPTLDPGVYYVFMDGFGATNSGSATMIVEVTPGEPVAAACNDMMDNDADGLVDLADPGCSSGIDDDELDPNLVQPACADGVDNDEDSLIDFPEDSFCLSAGSPSEAPLCASYSEPMIVVSESTQFAFDTSVETASDAYQNGTSASSPEIPFALVITQPSAVSLEIFEPESGYDPYLHVRSTDCDSGETIAFDDDSGSSEGTDNSTISPYLEFELLEPGVYYVFMDGYSSTNSGAATMIVGINPIVAGVSECADEIDNDEDDAIDLADDGCESIHDLIEGDALAPTACSDGSDADGDGLIGYPADPDCLGAGDTTDATYCTALPTQELSLNGELAGQILVDPPKSASFVTTGSCGADIGQPAAIVFDVPELSDVFVTLNAEGTDTAETSSGVYAASLREDCDDIFSEQLCVNGIGSNESTQVGELLPAGRYYLMVEHTGVGNAGAITVDLQLVSRVTECNDEIDNDLDGQIDLFDSGCIDGDSPSETVDPALPAPFCADGIDNDDDGEIDYPNDPDCTGAGDIVEQTLCASFEPEIVSGEGGSFRFEPNGQSEELFSCSFSSSGTVTYAVKIDITSTLGVIATDDDGDYASVYRTLSRTCAEDESAEISCESAFGEDVFVVTGLEPGWYFFKAHRSSFSSDPFNVDFYIVPEVEPTFACLDGVDNDEDSFIDLDDPGCESARDDSEADDFVDTPVCADGVDNDSDGLIDYPTDLDCRSAGDLTEETRCAELDSVDVDFVDQVANVIVSPNQFEDSEDVGSCELGAQNGTAAVVSFEIPALSDVTVSLSAGAFERYAYIRSACEDNEMESTELSCNLQVNNSNTRTSLLTAGRYYLHVKRVNPLDVSPINVTITRYARECADEIDNDGDGFIDLADLGCIDELDSTENTDADPDFEAPACGDGLDNDGDGLTDYPEDPECDAAGDVFERQTCVTYNSLATISGAGGSYSFDPADNYSGFGVDCSFSSGEEAVFTLEVATPSQITVNVTDDSDGEDASVYTALRTVCDNSATEIACFTTTLGPKVFEEVQPGLYFLVVHRSEFAAEDPFTVDIAINAIECADGIDNDEDGAIDAEDVGCESLRDLSENTDADPEFVTPECADGEDNDMDGEIDYPLDPECLTLGDQFEMPSCINYDIAAVVNSEGGVYEFSPEEGYAGIEVGCGFSAGQEAVYALYIDDVSQVTVSVTDADDDFSSTYVALRSDCDVESTELGCFTSTAPGPRVFSGVQPGLYFLIVHRSEFSLEDPFTVEISVDVQECADGIDNDGDNAIDADDVGCESAQDLSESTDAEPDFVIPECFDGIDNDMDGDFDYPNEDFCFFAGGTSEGPSCALYQGEIQVVSETTNFTVDTSMSQNNYTRGSSASGPEVPFALIVNETSDVTIAFSSDHDTYLHMREGNCDSDITYDFNDDGGEGLNSRLALTDVAPGLYFVFVDGFNGSASGMVTVDVIITAAQ